jgi:hypothetical protein
MTQQRAAVADALPVCKWLRAPGAEWPDELGLTDYDQGEDGYEFWSNVCSEWAKSEGCTSPECTPYMTLIAMILIEVVSTMLLQT